MQLVERLEEGKGGDINPIRYIQFVFIFEITVTQLLNQNHKEYLVIWSIDFVGWEKNKIPFKGCTNFRIFQQTRVRKPSPKRSSWHSRAMVLDESFFSSLLFASRILIHILIVLSTRAVK
jgi:hypothetical protein